MLEYRVCLCDAFEWSFGVNLRGSDELRTYLHLFCWSETHPGSLNICLAPDVGNLVAVRDCYG